MDNQTTATVAKTGQEAHGVNQVRALEGGKFLTFLMANEKYGLEILKVREIIGIMDVTSVPTTPAFVRGVINLRGKVIPVVDLRLKFGIEAKENTQRTCIIVVQLARTAHEMTMGIIVDEVSDVLYINRDQIEPPPSFGANIRTDFILGMGKVDQKVMTLLDIDRVLTEQEVALVESSAGKKGDKMDQSAKGKNYPGKGEE
ncbi:MAG: purine-binding chemotaxis protein CheW [Deltaproteobacteria bacterium]|nr:purine-binding chemotaxis protein CheW [Deltaproteobacteria bacterium]